jgi:apolipoprotein N-acyltransferase
MSRGKAFRAGFLMGAVYFFGTLYWIYHSINHYGGVSLLPSLAVAFLLALYMSLYAGVFGALFSWKITKTSLPALFLAPVFWVVLEFLRSYAMTGFPWSSLGYSQFKFLRIIQFADITGVHGVSFLVVAVNGALADIFITMNKRKAMPLFHLWPTYVGAGLLCVAFASALVYGNGRLREERPGLGVKVSVVQGNIRQDLKWDKSYQTKVIGIYKSLSYLANREQPSLIIWPETAVPFYYGLDRELTDEIVRFQRTLGTRLLFGAVTVKGEKRLANSAVMLNPDGSESYSYDKIHLVPFGEYVPLGRLLFFVNRLAEGIGDYAPGKRYLRAATPFGEFGTLICYEIIFPGLVRKFFKDGGDFIVTITNDAWFGRTPGPYQHFSFASLRAVENRKPVVRAANTGISGYVDSNGRIISSTSLFERTVLTEEIKTDSTRSFYSSYGDLFSYLCIVVTVILLMNIKRNVRP